MFYNSFAVQESIQNALADQKVFLQGCDTHGRAVVVVLGVRHLTHARDLSETIRLIVYVLDNAIAASNPVHNPSRQIICLLDLGGGSSSLEPFRSCIHWMLT